VSQEVGPERCHCGKVAEAGSEECHACMHGMPPARPRWVCGGYRIQGRQYACGRVVQQGDPGAETIEVMCVGCRIEWERAAPLAQVRSEKATERRIARGFGSSEGDPFEGMRGDE
jgi:hypothetical protein